ncbi:MAG: hypothetical protein WKF37_13695 [Bryobacteraceae bacterium]
MISRKRLAALFAVLCGAVVALGQDSRGTITGQISDSSEPHWREYRLL